MSVSVSLCQCFLVATCPVCLLTVPRFVFYVNVCVCVCICLYVGLCVGVLIIVFAFCFWGVTKFHVRRPVINMCVLALCLCRMMFGNHSTPLCLDFPRLELCPSTSGSQPKLPTCSFVSHIASGPHLCTGAKCSAISGPHIAYLFFPSVSHLVSGPFP